MSEDQKYKAGLGSDFSKDPVRIVFITKKTSAKVQETVSEQVMSHPHVVVREAIAFMLLSIVLVLIALFWDAPLEQVANPLITPNPAKAPWYFLGLQELLHYFPPIVAGVLIPLLVIVALIVVPYFHVNVQGKSLWVAGGKRRMVIFLFVVFAILVFFAAFKAWTVFVPTILFAGLAVSAYFIPPERGRFLEFLQSRALSWWLMTWFIVIAIILTVIGTFFRGPGWSFVLPWRSYGI
jgi:menaquinol-cytochrome c reductase cytochrome b/c subunit